MKIRQVTWRTPLGSYLSPYENKFLLVRHFAYGRFAAALTYAGENRAARVLDFGCWDGHFLPSLAARFSEVWGVDDDSGSVIDEVPGCWTTLQLAQRLCESELGDSPCTLIKATGSALPFPAGYFDIVFCLDTFAHVSQAEKLRVLKELSRITNPTGRVVISLPIETGFAQFIRKTLRRLSRKHPCNYSYDFRSDLKLLETNFRILAKEFWPSSVVRLAIMLDCSHHETFEPNSRG
jgi:SAM-dependent methyltransferase